MLYIAMARYTQERTEQVGLLIGVLYGNKELIKKILEEQNGTER
jgi:hypothetical protein